jgi:hypothetical protein
MRLPDKRASAPVVPGRRQILMDKILVTAMALGAVTKERFAMAGISVA